MALNPSSLFTPVDHTQRNFSGVNCESAPISSFAFQFRTTSKRTLVKACGPEVIIPMVVRGLRGTAASYFGDLIHSLARLSLDGDSELCINSRGVLGDK